MLDPHYVLSLTTPLGSFLLRGDDRSVTELVLPSAELVLPSAELARPSAEVARPSTGMADAEAADPAPSHLEDAASQLEAYLAGKHRGFDLPLDPAGTPFQREVWFTLASIPYGQTISYAELASKVGRPRAFRAVGQANGANPLPIFLPCHRVVASGGGLGGYSGGLDLKRALLALEREAVA